MTLHIGPFERLVEVRFGGPEDWRLSALARLARERERVTHDDGGGAPVYGTNVATLTATVRLGAYGLDDDATWRRRDARGAVPALTGSALLTSESTEPFGATTWQIEVAQLPALYVYAGRYYLYLTDGATAGVDETTPSPIREDWPLELRYPVDAIGSQHYDPVSRPELAALADGTYDLASVVADPVGLHPWATTSLTIGPVLSGGVGATESVLAPPAINTEVFTETVIDDVQGVDPRVLYEAAGHVLYATTEMGLVDAAFPALWLHPGAPYSGSGNAYTASDPFDEVDQRAAIVEPADIEHNRLAVTTEIAV